MIIIDGIEMRTAAQWAKKHRAVLKRQLKKGVYRTWNTPGGLVSADFYSEEQTRPYNKKELRRARKERRDLEKTRKERLSCRCCGEYFGQYAKWELSGFTINTAHLKKERFRPENTRSIGITIRENGTKAKRCGITIVPNRSPKCRMSSLRSSKSFTLKPLADGKKSTWNIQHMMGINGGRWICTVP